DHSGLAGLDLESAAQDHFARCVSFGENESRSQGTCDLVPDDQAADRGGRHDANIQSVVETAEFGRQKLSKSFGVLGMLQNERALQVLGAMQTAGQPEMAAQVSSGLIKRSENRVIRSVHIVRVAYRFEVRGTQYEVCSTRSTRPKPSVPC